METVGETGRRSAGGRGRTGPRLLLIGDYPPPWGGIAVHVRALLELAVREGFAVAVLDVGAGRRGGRAERVIAAGGPAGFSLRLARAAASGALVHAHVSGNNTKAWLVAAAAGLARLPGTRRGLLTVHSGLAPAFLGAGPRRRWLARVACRNYSRILCANAGIARALREAGVPAAKLEVLPAFARARLEPGDPPPAAVAARERFRPLLVAALAPGPQYGEDVLLGGLAVLAARNAATGLAVFGPGTAAAGFLARVAARGLADRVVALGELDHPAALGTMRLADGFLRPTRADGDSISVREALGLGVRVVASDVGHRPPAAALFRAGDPLDLAAKVDAALAAPGPAADAVDAAPRILELWRGPAAAPHPLAAGVER